MKSLSNIADKGGYLKKETKEDIQNVESVLKNIFTDMRAEIYSLNEEKMKLEMEVKDDIAEACMEEEDSRPKRQVAPSIGNTRKPESGNQHTVAPAGEMTNH